MSATSTTALDLITGALRNINAFEAGEPLDAQSSADALQVLNDMLESWSVDHLFVYASVENILSFNPGQYQYSVGNYAAGTFTGTLTVGSPVITGVTVPANLIARGDLDDTLAAIPNGATILSADPVLGTVTMSANALANTVPEVITYTVPGDFKIVRPLRITNAFTRITASGSTGLDYFIDIIPRDKYTALGFKGIAGPWPKALYYDPTFPLGTLYFYPNPANAGVLHLWTDTILADFAGLTQPINLPQGYARAIKKNLALELAPEYGKTAGALLVKQAAESKQMIKQLNAEPAVQAFYDSDLVYTHRTRPDFIMDGGFR